MAETATNGCPSSEFTRDSRRPAGHRTFHPSPAGHRAPGPGSGGPRPGTRPGTGNTRPVTGARPVPGRARVPGRAPAGLPGRGPVTGAPKTHRAPAAAGARPGRAGPGRPVTTTVVGWSNLTSLKLRCPFHLERGRSTWNGLVTDSQTQVLWNGLATGWRPLHISWSPGCRPPSRASSATFSPISRRWATTR